MKLLTNMDITDKSHLIREVKFLSGYTPNEFLSNADPYSDNRSLFQSFFVDIRI